MSKKRKTRVSLQKNRTKPPRDSDLTRKYQQDELAAEHEAYGERVRAKGSLSRKRTVHVDEGKDNLAVDDATTLRGRVLTTHGLYCIVVTDDGRQWKCYTRRLLKSLATDERGNLVTGDWAHFRPAPDDEGLIVAVEPRKRVLTRSYRRREQILAANVDQVLIVSSLAQPYVKPHLVDRYLVSAEQGNMEALICFNKVDLVEGSLAQPLVGLYSQLGYRVLQTSAARRQGIDALRDALTGRETVLVGQSGVGKSSLLNALEPTFHLRVREVSEANDKGRHTTTNAQMFRLAGGGSVVDTPGIRQFELWDSEGALDGFFVEFRPYAAHCRFPGCTHTHEHECAVKAAVEDGAISTCRYDSYAKLQRGEAYDAAEA